MGFFRQEYWSGLSFPTPGDLPDPGIEPRSPALQVNSLPSEPPGKHIYIYYTHFPSCHILVELIVFTSKARFLTPKPHSHVSWVSMVTFILIFTHCLVPKGSIQTPVSFWREGCLTRCCHIIQSTSLSSECVLMNI